MSGADQSNEDLVSGRGNRAEDKTFIWAQRTSDGDFDGDAIFIVEAARDIEGDDCRRVSNGIAVHGVRASGIGAGAGVLGSSRQLPVDGRGVGIVDAPGVVGFAGGVTGETIDIDTEVFGQGGIGVGGQGTSGPGVKGTGSPEQAGVLGIGGQRSDAQAKQGPGGVGVGHGSEVGIAFTSSLDTGVFGLGEDGVKGVGIGGRGGVFQADREAQVHLVPSRGPLMKEQTSFIPTVAADPGSSGAPLRKTGRAGDLMSVAEEQGRCTLWFCVQSGDARAPARWSQVLLGPPFDGRT